jgi:hypothetical protein
MNSRKNTFYAVLIGLFVVGSLAPAVMAQLPTLTAAGVADGFTLTTFATVAPGNTVCCGGPFGVAVASSGNVIVSVGGTATRYVFKDTDGQTIGSALFTAPSNSGVTAYATAGGQAYGAQNGQFVQFNPDGTVNHILTGVTTGVDLGMWGNPVTGHIEASSGSGLIDINPLANGGAGSFRVIAAGGNGDGVSVSPDGKIAYSEQGNINGYDIATGTLVFTSAPATFPSPDGTGVISSTNNLNGDIIVNNNNGEVDLLDPVTKAVTIIATGGSRGDYSSPDTNNGTLFLDFADVVGRLSCGADCSIGGPPPTPEPASLILLGTGLAALAGFKKKKQQNQA